MGLRTLLTRFMRPRAAPVEPAPVSYTADQLAAIEDLIRLINPTAELADQLLLQWRAHLAGMQPNDTVMGIVWNLVVLADWKATFRVDWKDAESAVDASISLAERWGVKLDFNRDGALPADFPDQARVAEVLVMAHREFAAHGLILWEWNSGWDDYCGWVTRREAQEAVGAIAARLGAPVRQAEQAGQDWPPEPA